MSSIACSVLNCINSKVGTPNKQFHFYPKNEELCKIWIERTNPYLRDKPLSSVRGYLICTDHFDSVDYATPLRTKLNRGAVPKLKLPPLKHFNVVNENEKVICQKLDDLYSTDRTIMLDDFQ